MKPQTGDTPQPTPADHARLSASWLIAALPDTAMREAAERLAEILRHHLPEKP